jgi:elongator complex protein 1
MAFVLAGRPDRAMAAYERAHLWRELFALAVTQKIGVDEMEDMCTRVAGGCLLAQLAT